MTKPSHRNGPSIGSIVVHSSEPKMFPELTDKSLCAEALDEIKSLSRPVANLPIIDEHPGLTESRIGGTPPWPEGQDIPRGLDGTPLVFLAQLDFKHVNLPDFPDSGILQFFIGSDDLYGCEFPTISNGADSATDFRVIYHEDPSILRHCLDYYEGCDLTQLETPFTVKDWTKSSFTLLPRTGAMTPHPSCKEGEELVERLEDKFEVDDGYLALEGKYPETHVGGYPIYTQGDIAYEPEHAEFDTVLLSIGSPENIVMFGDTGRANFLIRKEDLIRRDFSRVAYTWDCH